ncbi:BamA/TamA family outer membrane protein [Chitinophaga arvensicola]|uniref:Surface antigen n=1 Tax=Chitinophaga arvensicola TaxID=29529 RepID=A0A1I0S8H1_9BACT|nr:BamA/TamA family outer membrane protein [Chitinophaga arvensicola]SEW52395.1 Surface antigen [Chitinophaga arvensicola]
MMIKNTFFFLLFCCPLLAAAQELPADTTAPPAAPKGLFNRIVYYLKHTNDVKKKKKFDFSIIGGPYYAPETSAGIAVMAAAQYRTDYRDSLLPVSNASVYMSGSLTGFYGIGINSSTIFPHDKYRLSGKASFSSMPNKYWGIGYTAGNDKDNYTDYTLLTNKISADFSIRILPNLYAGIGVQVNNGQASKVDSGFNKPLMPTASVFGFGIGPFIIYDSRDFIPNAYKGMYARLGYKNFPAFLGNTAAFSGWELQVDNYIPLWKKAILATDVYGQSFTSNVPWTLMAEAGGSNRLRGYYEGRFRDKNYLAVQAEIRQRIYGRNGAAVWIGAGNVFPDINAFRFNQTLISYGIGYRWEFKKRVNIRLDYGMGKDQSGFYFGINEVF